MVTTSILRFFSLLALLLALALPAYAVGVEDYPLLPSTEKVSDGADVLSRAAIAELQRRLEVFSDARVDARVITLRRLDYGLSLQELADQLLERWQGEDNAELLVLIETGTNSVSIQASSEVHSLLPEELLLSTAETTMAYPLRDGGRYRQALIDGIDRLGVVLAGGDDPGPPVVVEPALIVSNIPSAEETANSNGFSWVIVLLVVGTLVPMATWWVFSR
ncbi:photosystem II repair protein Psb32 [Synechococcus sp. Cruz CV12-2-Slac-r]|uniref:photosystem II repair protein Psb32 n=1 Tax=Synechococcus sp. Cruz CV12-2-Slac-r TaxID=2823748 RepID=UPI0020CD8943|nr:TPM domain-containing protein [Synechococcus sp. Cruz CV12-2-Slac-r]MCP9939514.1 TPM domain-containing protein [Synechococcus sp. Cruz CV12-2-Slac-r]